MIYSPYHGYPFVISYFLTYSTSSPIARTSGAGIWIGHRFTCLETGLLNYVSAWLVITGTVSGSNAICEIRNVNTNGTPGTTVIASTSITTAAALTTGLHTWDFSSLNVTLNADTRYAVVLRNTAGTPNSNYFSVCFRDMGFYDRAAGWDYIQGLAYYTTTNSGSSWTLGTSGRYGVLVSAGNRLYGGVVGNTHANQAINASNRPGVALTIPSGMNLRVSAFGAYGYISGGTSTVRCLRYVPSQGWVPIATSQNVSYLTSAYYGFYFGFFDPPVTVSGGSRYLFQYTQTATATTSAVMRYVNMSNRSDLLSLYPFSSRMVLETTGFTEYDNRYPNGWALLLDPERPFESGDGGGASRVILPVMGGAL